MKKEGRKPIATNAAPAAIGPYSQGVVAGRFVYTSGQLPIDPATGKIPAGIQEQARLALANVRAVIEAAGSSLANVVKVTVFLTDISDFSAVNEVYKDVFGGSGQGFPARSALQVSALPKPEARIEIEAVATI